MLQCNCTSKRPLLLLWRVCKHAGWPVSPKGTLGSIPYLQKKNIFFFETNCKINY